MFFLIFLCILILIFNLNSIIIKYMYNSVIVWILLNFKRIDY